MPVIKRLFPLLLLAVIILMLTQTGCDELVTEQIFITEAGHPIAEFTLDSGFTDFGCAPYTVSFVDRSEGPHDKWLWIFGDGDSSTDTNPVHTYDSSGFFTVTLRIEDTETEGKDSEVKSRYIYVGTTNAGFTATPDSGCIDNEVSFRPDVIDDGMSFSWNFGDSTVSSDSTPTHIYDSAGEYEVSLTISDSCGLKTSYDTITVSPCPDWRIFVDKNEACVYEDIVFEDSSAPAPGFVITESNWWFGNGVRSFDNPVVAYAYPNPGTYTVTLQTISDGGQVRDSTIDLITVYDTTTAAFTLYGDTGRCYTPSQQLNIKFVADTVNMKIDSFYWDFGDGFVDSTSSPEVIHHYADPGEYTVRLSTIGFCNNDDTTMSDIVRYFDSLSQSQLLFASVLDSINPNWTFDSTFDSTNLPVIDTLVDTTFDTLHFYTFADNSIATVYDLSWKVTDNSSGSTLFSTQSINVALSILQKPYIVELSIFNRCDSIFNDTTMTLD